MRSSAGLAEHMEQTMDASVALELGAGSAPALRAAFARHASGMVRSPSQLYGHDRCQRRAPRRLNLA